MFLLNSKFEIAQATKNEFWVHIGQDEPNRLDQYEPKIRFWYCIKISNLELNKNISNNY